MNPQDFIIEIANSTAHRPVRDRLSGFVFQDKELLPVLISCALDITGKNHHKACWILELVLENKIVWLTEYLPQFCDTLSKYRNDGAIRSVSKICLFAITQHQKQKDFVSSQQLQQITEACFDWLINPGGKVANKAYAMRTLYLLGKSEPWIYPELQRILQEDFIKHTAAYKAAAKEILQKIKL
ncbi:hypothetical protein [Flavobacterium psychrotrophum]|uniref:hypothetical protein n=1 Tax=Flavobacterium psychrotrophum TaxID=2294119 RepID=UPI000E31F284|nr:hypothetical protein [Flavobacterium psychrotrophum]